MTAFADIADLPEDERIALIGKNAALHIVGFFVDDDAKADRYIQKLTTKYQVRFIERTRDVLVKNTVFVKVGPKGH